MITLSHISKDFTGNRVVNDISLKIKPGEIVGLLGPNGAGKTTTIRMITGVLPPSEGKLTINGKDYNGHEHELKQLIGYLPENNPLYEELTVEEHLRFWANIKGIALNKLETALDFAVESTGIQDVYYRFIGELSKGYRQRVGLAQAIINKPEILILDEPTEGLDPNQRRDIQKLLSELKESRTVIVSSHVLSEISKLANRVIIIHQGSVVGDDTPEKLSAGKIGMQSVLIEVKNAKSVITALKKLKGVSQVEKVESNRYHLEAESKNDIREAIFKTAVENKWTLLGMQTIERQLEDVFSELTNN